MITEEKSLGEHIEAMNLMMKCLSAAIDATVDEATRVRIYKRAWEMLAQCSGDADSAS